MAVSKIEYFGETLIDLTNDTVSADTILAGYTAHGKDGEQITGTLEVKEEQEKTVTPTSSIQEVIPDDGKTLSKVTVNGDSDLVAENIKKDIEIFGVTGTYEGEGSSVDLKGLFEGTITSIDLPSDLTKIRNYAFLGLTNLTSISLSSGITTIGSQAFANCSKLESISLPSGLTFIDSYAFLRCPRLILTSLPGGLTSIGSSAFNSCKGLTSITFKGTPTTIANNAFQGCTNLKTINVPWASGTVANAPWGATNATINYNYTG